MQRSAYEQLNREINLLLDYNPSEISQDNSSDCPKFNSPLSFYDKHLDEQLTLKKVVIIPSLSTKLSEPVNRASKSIKDKKLLLPLIRRDDAFSTLESIKRSREKGPVIDAQFVGRVYGDTTARFSRVIASMFSLHLHAGRWSSALSWTQRPTTRWQRYYALIEDFSLEVNLEPSITMPEEVLESMDETVLADLKQVKQRFPMLATWQIFSVCPEIEDALKNMGNHGSIDIFPYQICLTRGHRRSDATFPRPSDALTTPWSISMSSFIADITSSDHVVSTTDKSLPLVSNSTEQQAPPLRRSARAPTKDSVKRVHTKRTTSKRASKIDASAVSLQDEQMSQWPKITLPSQRYPEEASNDKEHMTASIIQHAWVRAVQKDSTFIILHCGNFERIGFRHRSSQTLYMSDLIDVTRCTDPAYGQIHIGLYMSIIEDALDRTRQQLEHEHEVIGNTRGKRRRGTMTFCDDSKRPKTRALVQKEAARKIEQKENYQMISKEASTRNLILLRFQYGKFNSPAPAAFLRFGKSAAHKQDTYMSHEYILLTLISDIAAGATGDVHGATLEVFASNGKTLHHEVVVKLALEPDQQKRMRHEFSVYQHLISSGVKGIPDILGLFEDVESDALALVMNHVGTCIWDRRPDKDKIEFTVSESERVSFIEVMKDIHRSGVRHRDIRPENMVANDDGTVTIIDFDQAELEASEGSRKREFEHLLALLNGHYTPPEDLPSLRTPDGSSRSPSRSESD